MTEHNHCWHSTGIMLTSYPPQHQYQCCFCGEMKTVVEAMLFLEGDHGPYVPLHIKSRPVIQTNRLIQTMKDFADAEKLHAWLGYAVSTVSPEDE